MGIGSRRRRRHRQHDRFAVIDTETTGLGTLDRVVELAIVTLDGGGEVIDEWATLLNPGRDVGPTDVHRISASAVLGAPRFDQVIGDVIERLHGAVVVAHNLPFDVRMIAQELDRIDVDVDWGSGADTLRLTGRRLFDACAEHDIALEGWHSALVDARATAELFRRVGMPPADYRPVRAGEVPIRIGAPLKPRSAGDDASPIGTLTAVTGRLAHRGADPRLLPYLDVVGRVVADGVVTDAERSILDGLADELALTRLDQQLAHTRFVDDLVAAAVVDGVLDADELAEVTTVAALLGVDPTRIDLDAMRGGGDGPDWEFRTDSFEEVCFTGTVVDAAGRRVDRDHLRAVAMNHWLIPVDTVTKRTSVLVAADPGSLSGKARRARRYGVPVVSVDEFLSRLRVTPP